MKRLMLERKLLEAYLRHLSANGYYVTRNNSKLQPFFISHNSTPELTHILEISPDRKSVIIPERLHDATINFYKLIGML